MIIDLLAFISNEVPLHQLVGWLVGLICTANAFHSSSWYLLQTTNLAPIQTVFHLHIHILSHDAAAENKTWVAGHHLFDTGIHLVHMVSLLAIANEKDRVDRGPLIGRRDHHIYQSGIVAQVVTAVLDLQVRSTANPGIQGHDLIRDG